MTMKVTVTWSGGFAFTGHPPSGHAVPMDGAPSIGGADSAPRPTELVLAALGGCTGIDVISILTKMRREITGFSLELEGDQDEEHPRKFNAIRLLYRVEGRNLDEAAVRRAIELSEQRYCSVGATLKNPVSITWSLELSSADEPTKNETSP